MSFEPGNTSFCLVLGAAAGNSSLSEVSNCWECEEQLGFSDQLLGNLNSINCTECLQNVCTDFVTKQNWYRSRSLSMVLVAAFMGVLMLLGIPGNMIVLVVYYFKKEKNTGNMFMMALAGIDLHACLVIHPYIISKCIHFYSLTTWVCKIFEYLMYVSQGSQALTLVAVAVDRYYAVYKPLAFGYAENVANMILICLGVGIASGIPIIFFYGKKTVWLYDQQNAVHIRSHVCHYSDEYDGSRDYFMFIIYSLVSLLLVVTVIVILYILIAVKIKKRNAQVGPLGLALVPIQADSTKAIKPVPVGMVHSKQSTETSPTATAHQNDQSEDTKSDGRLRNNISTPQGSTKRNLIGRQPNKINVITALDIQPIAHCSSTTPPIPKSQAPTSLNVSSSVSDQALRVHIAAAVHPVNKITAGFKGCKVLFIVTAVFFLSWLPFWVLLFLYKSSDWWENIQFTNALLSHLFLLNNAVNPILYAFINRKFREECKMTKKKIFTRLRYMCC